MRRFELSAHAADGLAQEGDGLGGAVERDEVLAAVVEQVADLDRGRSVRPQEQSVGALGQGEGLARPPEAREGVGDGVQRARRVRVALGVHLLLDGEGGAEQGERGRRVPGQLDDALILEEPRALELVAGTTPLDERGRQLERRLVSAIAAIEHPADAERHRAGALGREVVVAAREGGQEGLLELLGALGRLAAIDVGGVQQGQRLGEGGHIAGAARVRHERAGERHRVGVLAGVVESARPRDAVPEVVDATSRDRVPRGLDGRAELLEIGAARDGRQRVRGVDRVGDDLAIRVGEHVGERRDGRAALVEAAHAEIEDRGRLLVPHGRRRARVAVHGEPRADVSVEDRRDAIADRGRAGSPRGEERPAERVALPRLPRFQVPNAGEPRRTAQTQRRGPPRLAHERDGRQRHEREDAHGETPAAAQGARDRAPARP